MDWQSCMFGLAGCFWHDHASLCAGAGPGLPNRLAPCPSQLGALRRLLMACSIGNPGLDPANGPMVFLRATPHTRAKFVQLAFARVGATTRQRTEHSFGSYPSISQARACTVARPCRRNASLVGLWSGTRPVADFFAATVGASGLFLSPNP